MPDRDIRIYATLSPLRLECPGCTSLILFSASQPHQLAYDKLSSTIKCPHCGRSFQLGILIWSVSTKGRKFLPSDMRPSARQLAELRNYGRGFWTSEGRQKAGPVNRYAGECTCGDLPWRAGCEVHDRQSVELEGS